MNSNQVTRADKFSKLALSRYPFFFQSRKVYYYKDMILISVNFWNLNLGQTVFEVEFMKGESLCQFLHFISSGFGDLYPNETIILYLKHDTSHPHQTRI